MALTRADILAASVRHHGQPAALLAVTDGRNDTTRVLDLNAGPLTPTLPNAAAMNLVKQAGNLLQQSATKCAHYKLSKRAKIACDEAIQAVETYNRKYTRELKANGRVIQQRRDAKKKARALESAQRALADAQMPSQENPDEPDEEEEEEEEDEAKVDSGDSDDNGDDDSMCGVDLDSGSDDEGVLCCDVAGDDDGGPDGGAEPLRKKAKTAAKQKKNKASESSASTSAMKSLTVAASPARSDASSKTLVMGPATGDRYASLVVGSFEGPPFWASAGPRGSGHSRAVPPPTDCRLSEPSTVPSKNMFCFLRPRVGPLNFHPIKWTPMEDLPLEAPRRCLALKGSPRRRSLRWGVWVGTRRARPPRAIPRRRSRRRWCSRRAAPPLRTARLQRQCLSQHR